MNACMQRACALTLLVHFLTRHHVAGRRVLLRHRDEGAVDVQGAI
jgi:hypothetical protein